ncbi:MAG: hypothetical protein LUD72_00940 [Bacteroidales bacterium]|nr:hypothetical protein [Bacteroidales bacterium]
MRLFRRLKEKLIRRRNKKRSDWTLKDAKYMLVGKRFTHTDMVCNRILYDFVITDIEPHNDIPNTYFLIYNGGRYAIDPSDLVDLSIFGFSSLLSGDNYCMAFYKVKEI